MRTASLSEKGAGFCTAQKIIKERPILFSTSMVQAILDGSKTQTRRAIKHIHWDDKKEWWAFPAPKEFGGDGGHAFAKDPSPSELLLMNCPYGKIGEHLWVRETWTNLPDSDLRFAYKASTGPESEEIRKEYLAAGAEWAKWKPSIHMPRTACRIVLEITDIRAERLNEISEEDAVAEGVKLHSRGVKWLNYLDEKSGLTQFIYNCFTAKQSFHTLWELINGRKSWFENPWVWAISFKVVELNGKEVKP